MSETVKVLIVVGQLEVGGTERQLLNVLPKINGDPLEVAIYTLRGSGRLEPEFIEAGIRVISPVHHSRRWFGLVRTAMHLVGTLRAEHPQILHFFLPEAYLLGGICSLLAPRCVRLMSRRSLNRYQSKWPVVRPIERFLHRRMDGILANSQAVLAELHAEGVSDAISGVIYNGVAELPHREPQSVSALRAEFNVSSDAIVFVMVANLIPYKGHANLIAAFEIARAHLPQSWTLLLIGSDSGIADCLLRQVGAAKLDTQIRWLGRRDDAQALLAIADIALLTSYEEGFSNVILEAMAAGLPVIATAVGGNVEAILDGETGVIVPPGDVVTLAEAIVRLADNVSLRQRMAKAGRQRALDHFSLSQCTDAYRRIYLNLGRGDRSPISTLIRAKF